MKDNHSQIITTFEMIRNGLIDNRNLGVNQIVISDQFLDSSHLRDAKCMQSSSSSIVIII
jgi:hypothetical protein